MSTTRIATVTATIFALLGPVACSESGTTGPEEAPSDEIQRVTVSVATVEVTGSCDHDSPFESSDNGEFDLQFDVTPSGSAAVTLYGAQRAFVEGEHTIGGSITFDRNVTAGEAFEATCRASEFDGVLGPDSDFDAKVTTQDHSYAGDNIWRPGRENAIALEGKGDAELCGVTLHYEIDSSLVSPG